MHPYRTTPYTVNGNAAHDRRASLHACAATPRPWGSARSSGRFLMEPWRRRRSRSKKKGVGRASGPPACNASGSVTSTSLSPSLLSGLGQRDAVLGGQAAAAMVATDRCVATRSLSLSRGTVHVQKPWTGTVTPRLRTHHQGRRLLQTSARRTSRGPHARQRVLYLNSRGIVAMRRGADGIYSVVAAEAYRAVVRCRSIMVAWCQPWLWCGACPPGPHPRVPCRC
jgi:hypothetical protein